MSRETFTALLAPHMQSIRAFVRSKLRAPDHVDDVFQKTLLLAFARRDQLRVQSKFRSWLCSIAINEVRMFLRSARPNIALDEFPLFELADHTPSPLAKYEEREREKRLHACIARLAEQDRTTIRMLDLDEMGLDEAAEKLAVSKAALKSTRFRARRRLAEAFSARV